LTLQRQPQDISSSSDNSSERVNVPDRLRQYNSQRQEEMKKDTSDKLVKPEKVEAPKPYASWIAILFTVFGIILAIAIYVLVIDRNSSSTTQSSSTTGAVFGVVISSSATTLQIQGAFSQLLSIDMTAVVVNHSNFDSGVSSSSYTEYIVNCTTAFANSFSQTIQPAALRGDSAFTSIGIVTIDDVATNTVVTVAGSTSSPTSSSTTSSPTTSAPTTSSPSTTTKAAGTTTAPATTTAAATTTAPATTTAAATTTAPATTTAAATTTAPATTTAAATTAAPATTAAATTAAP